MNKTEAKKLLAMIKVAYPIAYKDLSAPMAEATANLWQTSFGDIPYDIIALAFSAFVQTSKKPPTIADMCEALNDLHTEAQGRIAEARGLGGFSDETKLARLNYIVDNTTRFSDYQKRNVALDKALNTPEKAGGLLSD